MRFDIVFSVAWSFILSVLSVLFVSWVDGLPLSELLKNIIQYAYMWVIFLAWAYGIWIVQRKRLKETTSNH